MPFKVYLTILFAISLPGLLLEAGLLGAVGLETTGNYLPLGWIVTFVLMILAEGIHKLTGLQIKVEDPSRASRTLTRAVLLLLALFGSFYLWQVIRIRGLGVDLDVWLKTTDWKIEYRWPFWLDPVLCLYWSAGPFLLAHEWMKARERRLENMALLTPEGRRF